MKQLMRRLSRVADSSSSSLSQYCQLRGAGVPAADAPTRRQRSFRLCRRSADVPQGHLPVYVGDEMERFVVSAELLNHPVFVELLNKSAQEYGYGQKGALRIPCHVIAFERFLEGLRLGAHPLDLQDLVDA